MSDSFGRLVEQLEMEDFFITPPSAGQNDLVGQLQEQQRLSSMRDIPLFLQN